MYSVQEEEEDSSQIWKPEVEMVKSFLEYTWNNIAELQES